MALDSSGLPAADAPVPPADSPAPADGTQAGNSPAPPQPVEDNARVIAAQAALTRKAQEAADLRRELDELRAANEAPDADEGDEPPVRQPRGAPSQREIDALNRAAAAEAAVAESIYGTDVVDAYDKWLPMWNGTTTKADEITALLAFADTIRGAAAQAPAPAAAPAAGGLPTREQALQPRVDMNRPDAPAPDGDLDPKKFEGADDGGRSFFAAQLARITGKS